MATMTQLGGRGAATLAIAAVAAAAYRLTSRRRTLKRLEQHLADALRADAGLAGLPVTAVVQRGRRPGHPRIEISGQVPTAGERDAVITVLAREAERLHPLAIVDRLQVVPGMAPWAS